MKIAMVGLGRMGANLVRRLSAHGHGCVVYDQSKAAVEELVRFGARGADSLYDLPPMLERRRVVWVMLPAGAATEGAIMDLAGFLDPEDIVIDGGNTFWQDDIRRSQVLAQLGIEYVDIGTSGGVWGLERGYCLMVGGKAETVAYLDPILRALAPGGNAGSSGTLPHMATDQRSRAEYGYLHCGPNGSGHFAKMIHNGIEYGMMQALAEGFDILKNANSTKLPQEHRFDFDLPNVAELWRHGSVVSSWLLDLTARALADDHVLSKFSGQVGDSGEGRWTVQAAIDEAVPADVLTAALYVRFRSRQDHTFAEKILSAMRFQFGGHVESQSAVAER